MTKKSSSFHLPGATLHSQALSPIIPDRQMTTPEKSDRKTKNRLWAIGLLTLLVLTITTTTADILDTNHSESPLVVLLIIPSMPGFLIYVLVTGDIHGWQSGPIGQAGRIIVTTLGSWIFWTPLIYWIYKRIKE